MRALGESSATDIELSSRGVVNLEDSPPNPSQGRWPFTTGKKLTAALSFLLANVGVLFWIGFDKDGKLGYKIIPSYMFTPNAFKFQVYCPIIYYANLTSTDTQTNLTNYTYGPYQIDYNSINGSDFNASSTYIISVISTYDDSGNAILQYCGLAKEWNGNCTEPVHTCTSPGPMFDFLVGQKADVIWLNQLNPYIVPNPIGSGSCMDPNDKNPAKNADYCNVTYRDKDNVTFFKSPNSMHENNKDEHSNKIKIGPSDWPYSTHLHGLQVRPQFDGNPQSWVSNSGRQGLGVIPLNKECYYDSFNKGEKTVPPNIRFTNDLYNTGKKINRYMNVQNPGNLWYHDHSMHLTQYNVGHGLYGIYIIRDPSVQKLLPTGQNQKFLLKTVNGWANESFCLDNSVQCQFNSDHTYRYRILNSDGKNNIEISFTSQNCNKTDYKKINFTIIGADSSLFNETIPNISIVQLGTAERVQLLITFDKSMTSFRICETNITDTDPDPDPPTNNNKNSAPPPIRKYQTIGENQKKDGHEEHLQKSELSLTKNLTLGVPFTDFSLIKNDDINVFRMRPLMVTTGFKFLVNGHYDFHKGAAENPVIGSIEDWYIINTINLAHPIHVHLINFQVTQILKLRHIKSKNNISKILIYCSFYEMDFLFQSMVLSKNETVRSLLDIFVKEGKINYIDFCPFYKNNGTVNISINNKNKQVPWADLYFGGIDVSTYEVNIQDQVDPTTRTSGIDVRELIEKGNSSYTSILETTNCPLNTTHKYLCRESTNNKTWYKKWKDTALVDPMKVFKYRIRWTKSNYTEGGPYFQYPSDQLMQFPGYIYHCHILGHEDNEMMRAIMLKPPPDSPTNIDPSVNCSQTNWEDKYKCLNKLCAVSNKQDGSTAPSSDPPRRLQQQ